MNSDVRCGDGKVVIVGLYYFVRRPGQDTKAHLLVWLSLVCRGSPGKITITSVRADGEHHKWFSRLRKAAVEFATDPPTDKVLGTILGQQLRDSSIKLSPYNVGLAISEANERLSNNLKNAIEGAASNLVVSSGLVDVGSGIATAFILEPIEEPVSQAIEGVALIGITLGIMTGQPALVAECAEQLIRIELKHFIRTEITDLLTASRHIPVPSQGDELILELKPAPQPHPTRQPCRKSGPPSTPGTGPGRAQPGPSPQLSRALRRENPGTKQASGRPPARV